MTRVVAVHGETVEERAAARRVRTRQRRAHYYVALMDAARPGMDRLRHASDYLRAVAKDLPTADADRLALAMTALADEWNQR